MDDSFGEPLRRIRRRKRLFWAVVVTYLPLAMVLTAAREALVSRGHDAAGYAGGLTALYAVLFAFTYARVLSSACPRCGKAFHRVGRSSRPWVQSCVHCELSPKD